VLRIRDQSEADGLAEAYEKLERSELQQQALKARYISCMDWLERAATRSRRAHYAMRLTAAVGGVIVTSMSAGYPHPSGSSC